MQCAMFFVSEGVDLKVGCGKRERDGGGGKGEGVPDS